MRPDNVWFGQQGDDSDLLQTLSRIFGPDAPHRFGVAVSGGGDSMALLHMSARLARRAGRDIQAVTVDHGLRPESAAEAQQVADFCSSLEIRHGTLRWQADTETSGNLQARAREARYDLIARWAKDRGIDTVLLGHTTDDQAETFLMRLARKSGVDGLSMMDAEFSRQDVSFCRPLLSATRAAMRDYLVRNDVPWSEDPSNNDSRFERVRARQALQLLTRLGIGTDEISAVSRNISEARIVLDLHARDAAQRMVRQDRGDLIFDTAGFQSLPSETSRRLLLAALRWIGGATYPQRSDALAGFEAAIVHRIRKTLGGCIVRPEGDGAFRITREWSALRDTIGPTDALWDRGRWRLTGPFCAGAHVRALGEDGILSCPDWRETALPRQTLLASPSIWEGDFLIAAPLAGLDNGWTAKLAKGRDIFVDSIGSH